jgi:hypothetical protein
MLKRTIKRFIFVYDTWVNNKYMFKTSSLYNKIGGCDFETFSKTCGANRITVAMKRLSGINDKGRISPKYQTT